MITFVIYDASSGEIASSGTVADESSLDGYDLSDGMRMMLVERPVDHVAYMVANGALVHRGLPPSIHHYWNGSEWELNAVEEFAAEAAKVRSIRNRRLASHVDSMNPMRWETMSDDQRSAWTSYRQALLDVPQQDGFPRNVVWPSKPQ